MAAIGSGRGTMDSQNQVQSDTEDRLKLLYPNVNEDETPLPRSWSTKDKFSYIGLSQNNLRVHYKGRNSRDLFMGFIGANCLSCRSPKCHHCMQKEIRCLLIYFKNIDVSTFGPRVGQTSGIRQTKKSADRIFCNNMRKMHDDHAELKSK